MGDVAMATIRITTARSIWPRTSASIAASNPGQAIRRDRHSVHAFDYGTADAYDFYLRMGPLSNSNEKYLKNANPFWNDNLKHSNYDEFWQRRALAPHMKNVKPR